jgi:hypothetical protein
MSSTQYSSFLKNEITRRKKERGSNVKSIIVTQIKERDRGQEEIE